MEELQVLVHLRMVVLELQLPTLTSVHAVPGNSLMVQQVTP